MAVGFCRQCAPCSLFPFIVVPRFSSQWQIRWYHCIMSKGLRGVFLPAISLERASPVPLYKQLYEAIRQAILSGTLNKGLRLPSTRLLAAELKVSRNIVVIAFEQLLAEGYIQSRTGAGTFVTKTLPDEVLQVQSRSGAGSRTLSERGRTIRKLASFVAPPDPKLRYAPFRYGLPALDHLPLELWGRLLARYCRKASAEIAVHGDPAGLRRLREAVASYAGVARGVRCHADQVIIEQRLATGDRSRGSRARRSW